jgi:hypothetical protein
MINGLKKIVPEAIKKRLRLIYTYLQVRKLQVYQNQTINRIRKKNKIEVVFIIYLEAEWKYEELYQIMIKDSRFEPVIVICPYISFGEETMFREMGRAYEYFKKGLYNVVKAFDEKINRWLNINEELKPDVVFFSDPWGISRPEYLITNFKKVLTCYVPYTFVISYLNEAYFNHTMHNLVWKFFLETKIHKKISKQYSNINGKNTIVTGYPGLDILMKKGYQPKDVWKINDKKIKRIIWSPHHTISGKGATLNFSTFLKYYDVMFKMADKFKNRIQIAFKPHPMLRLKLNLDDVWGKEKTDAYYNKWAELSNGRLFEGEYVNLFYTSDGIINDSSSFLIEYLCTNKPQLFLVNDDSVSDRFNEVGKKALDTVYTGKSVTDIESFIETVILNNQDIMEKERTSFYNSIVKPPNNITASENIFNYLKSEILR